VSNELRKRLEGVYERLFTRYGPQFWWPGEEPFEVMVGAVLTQSVAWKNVETAIAALKEIGALSPAALREMSLEQIAALIRPTVYYNVKARKLKALVGWFGESCRDSLAVMREKETFQLRNELLNVWGIGEETADSIVLYAAEKPVFVIDAYTRRILGRIGLKPDRDTYADYQAMFMKNLPADVPLFNEYHALFVRLGKEVCRPKPLCGDCCLKEICSTGEAV
jgi:endonuclease-3 related protein